MVLAMGDGAFRRGDVRIVVLGGELLLGIGSGVFVCIARGVGRVMSIASRWAGNLGRDRMG